MNLLANGKTQKIAKIIVITSCVVSFVSIWHTPVAEAKWHFRGGNVHDSSRYKQVVEWVKQEQAKLEQIKAKLQHSLDTVKQAKQAMNTVKSSINSVMHQVDSLRSNVNTVMKMTDGLIKLDFNQSDKAWSEIQYSPEAIHYEGEYIQKKVDNNKIVSKANLESQKIAVGLGSIADANDSVIDALQQLGRNTKGLLDSQEVSNEMQAVEADTELQTAKARASAINTELQEKIIQYENEKAANQRRAKDFQVTSDPEQRTDKEISDLKRLEADSKPGRGFVEF